MHPQPFHGLHESWRAKDATLDRYPIEEGGCTGKPHATDSLEQSPRGVCSRQGRRLREAEHLAGQYRILLEDGYHFPERSVRISGKMEEFEGRLWQQRRSVGGAREVLEQPTAEDGSAVELPRDRNTGDGCRGRVGHA